MMEIGLIALSTCLLLTLCALFWLQRKLRVLEAKLDAQQHAIQGYNGDLASLCAAAVVVDRKVCSLDERLHHLNQTPQFVVPSETQVSAALYTPQPGEEEDDESTWLDPVAASDNQAQAAEDSSRGELNAYQNAIDKIRQGATVEELIKGCGLTRDEADLLLRLHGGPNR